MNIETAMFLGFGVCIGWASSNFMYGRRYCYECWLALIKGRRDEAGCENCMNALLNERINKVR